MAQEVTSDSTIAAALKHWYTREKFEQLFARNSQVWKGIPKNRIGGSDYNFANLYAYGGACSADWTVAIAQAAIGQAKNAQFSVPPGYFFSVFNISQIEKFASRDEKGAYVKLAIDKMFAATEALRKQSAKALYGTGYGEFGLVPTGGAAAAATTVKLPGSAIVGISVGTVFDVTTTTSPSGALDGTGPFTVTAIAADGTVTFTPAVGTAWVAGAYLEYHGGRDGSGNPNYPTGLGGWLPTTRPVSATPFYGVNRSVNEIGLAGNFYQGPGPDTKAPYSSAITELLKLTRRWGGNPKMLVLNDDDMMTVQTELQAYRNYWQDTDKATLKNMTFGYGIEDYRYAFSANYLEYVYDDPYCPQGTFYVLDPEVIEFVALSNPDRPGNDGIEGNNPGAPEVTGEEDPTTNPFQLVIDDYLDIRPATATATGPAAQVTLALYGNFAVRNAAHCGVGLFA